MKWIVDNKLEFDFIVFTGDMTTHDVWHQTAERNINDAKIITDLLKKYFPDK